MYAGACVGNTDELGRGNAGKVGGRGEKKVWILNGEKGKRNSDALDEGVSVGGVLER